MKIEFVPFELAKKLKKIGYPQIEKNTLAMYDEDGEWYSLATTIGVEYCFVDFNEHDCVCPTIEQVLTWIREVHNIHIATGVTPRSSWRFVIMFCDERGLEEPTVTENNFHSFEDAVIEGIEYVIKNLIKV